MDARRVKRLIHAREQKALVLNDPGLQEVTRRELASLLAAPLQPLDDDPQAADSDDGILLSCLSFRRLLELAQRLQTAPDIFWVLAEKRVASPAELTRAIAAIPWNLVLAPNAAVRVAADSRGSRLYHEGLIRETAERVLADHGFSTGREAGARVKILLRENHLMIGLALYEEPLYKRGNKAQLRATAPLKETLAAGLIQAAAHWLHVAGLPMPVDVYVPFAGSGTLGLEVLAFHAGFSWHAFFRTPVIAAAPCYPAETAAFITRRLQENAATAPKVTVQLLDHHDEMVGVLGKTLEKVAPYLSEAACVTCEAGDFFTRAIPDDAFLPLHPPYGDRLGVADVGNLFQRIAVKLSGAKRVSGFILIPEESAWSGFLRNLKGFSHETRHVSQGGKDARVVFFRSSER